MLFASNLQYDTGLSLARILKSDYKDNLVDAIHAMGYPPRRGTRRELDDDDQRTATYAQSPQPHAKEKGWPPVKR